MMVEQRICAHSTPSGHERAMGIWVSLVGHYRSHQYNVMRRIKDDSILVYCVEGSGKVALGEQSLLVRAGDVFLLPAHIYYDCASDPQEGWEIWWVRFEGSYALQLTEWLGLSVESPMFHIGRQAEVLSHFQTIYQLLQQKERYYCLDATGALVQLFVALQKCKREETDVDFERFRSLSYQATSLEQLAQDMGYSKYHFIRVFKKATGTTPWAYVLQLKMDHAKELLLSTSYSIKEVAQHVGFSNALYFSRIFRKHTGMSPSQFRESWFGEHSPNTL